MGELDAVVDRTLAAGTARLRLFRAPDPSESWRDVGHGTAELRLRRTHILLRPIPPDGAPVGLPPDTEIEYLFDGGRRWVRGLDEKQWSHPLGAFVDSRQVADPIWILDALLGATVVGDQHDVASGLGVSLDLVAAERATGRRVDIGRGRTALLWRPRLRAWRKAVPARVWVDDNGRLARVEHLDPPWSRLFPSRMWNGVEFSALGEPVDVPAPPSSAVA